MFWKSFLPALPLLACLGAAQVASDPSPELVPIAADSVRGEVSKAVLFAAGDSARFVASFTVPAVTPPIDSAVVRWSMGGNTLQVHTFKPPYPATTRDTARFVSPPLSAGGSQANGTVTVQTFRAQVPSTGFSRSISITRPAPPAPPDVGAFAFVDSAVAYP